MSSFEHHRFGIIHLGQHILQHDFDQIFYSNHTLPGISNGRTALDYICAVLFPEPKPAVATPAALPAVGNTLYDYRVVTDDGDGKAAGYRWEQRQGDATAKWYKIYDMDWGLGTVMSHFTAATQDLYPFKYGIDDRDDTGTIVAGVFSGQTIYGGASASTNLTLIPNSGNGLGAQTGYVQIGGNFRPITDSLFSLGTTTERFLKIWTDEIQSGTLVATGGSITDSSGSISFDNENLSTTGTFTAPTGYFSSSVEVGPLLGNALVLAAGSITDQSGSISFDNENLSTTGTITGASGYFTTGVEVGPVLGNALLLGPGSIKDESGAISFDNENLNTTGSFTGATGYFTSAVEVGTLLGNALILSAGSITDESGAISFDNENLTTTGTITAGTFLATQLSLTGSTISTRSANTVLTLSPHGSGTIEATASFSPAVASAVDLGTSTKPWKAAYFSGDIAELDGTRKMAIGDLMGLRFAPYRDVAKTQPAQNGDSIFWSAANACFLASAPDTEITHSTISGLTTGDAGHTQFVVLTGRAGGQIIQGGTLASQALTLSSTAHATKGLVQIATGEVFAPQTDASYSGGWSGSDLGDATHFFRDIYLKGVLKNGRLENFTAGTLPAASATTPGRAVWVSDSGYIAIDTGGTWVGVNMRAGELINTLIPDAATGTITALSSSNISGIRLTTNSASDVHGIANGSDGKFLTIHATAAEITIKNDSGSASAANRIITGSGADTVIPIGGATLLQYDATAQRWRILAGSGGSSANKQNQFNGIEDPTKVTFSYNKTTRVLSVTYAAGAVVWVSGTKYAKSGTYNFTGHANSTNVYFYYINSSGVETVSTTAWDLLTTAPICAVYYSATQVDGIVIDERHPAGTGMDDSVHKYLHTTRGAQKVSGFAISGYTASSATSTQATMQAAIASGVIADEDLSSTIAAVSAAGPYTHLYRSGATDWVWTTSVDMFLSNGTNPYYNQLVTGSYQQTAMTSGNRTTFWNQYLVALQTTTGAQVFIVQGQNTYTSAALAQAEDPNLSISGLSNISQEFVYIGRLTFSRTAAGTRYMNTLLESVQLLSTNSLSSIAGANPGDHQSLSGRSTAGAHPASAVAVVTSSFAGALSSADDTVQKALDTLDDAVRSTGWFNTTSITPNTQTIGPESWSWYTAAADATFTGFGSLASMTHGKRISIFNISAYVLTIASSDTVDGWLTNGTCYLAPYRTISFEYNSIIGRFLEVSRS